MAIVAVVAVPAQFQRRALGIVEAAVDLVGDGAVEIQHPLIDQVGVEDGVVTRDRHLVGQLPRPGDGRVRQVHRRRRRQRYRPGHVQRRRVERQRPARQVAAGLPEDPAGDGHRPPGGNGDRPAVIERVVPANRKVAPGDVDRSGIIPTVESADRQPAGVHVDQSGVGYRRRRLRPGEVQSRPSGADDARGRVVQPAGPADSQPAAGDVDRAAVDVRLVSLVEHQRAGDADGPGVVDRGVDLRGVIVADAVDTDLTGGGVGQGSTCDDQRVGGGVVVVLAGEVRQVNQSGVGESAGDRNSGVMAIVAVVAVPAQFQRRVFSVVEAAVDLVGGGAVEVQHPLIDQVGVEDGVVTCDRRLTDQLAGRRSSREGIVGVGGGDRQARPERADGRVSNLDHSRRGRCA